MENRRQIGYGYEDQAAEYLKRQGFKILKRNFYCKTGEIDIIARDGRYLVFVEIKYRKNGACGHPLEAVDTRKQRKICKTASYFCLRYGYGDTAPCRFDVVAVMGDEVTHIRNAFEYRV